jgi:hypothetical protein
MRTESVLGVSHRFVQAKSRLQPIKAAFTIPRMELLAAEMGLALAKNIVTILNVRHEAICLWTDLRVVHDWLPVESRVLQRGIDAKIRRVTVFNGVTHLGQAITSLAFLVPADGKDHDNNERDGRRRTTCTDTRSAC